MEDNNKLVIMVENIEGRLVSCGIKAKKDILDSIKELVPPGSKSEIEFTVNAVQLFEPESTDVENEE